MIPSTGTSTVDARKNAIVKTVQNEKEKEDLVEALNQMQRINYLKEFQLY